METKHVHKLLTFTAPTMIEFGIIIRETTIKVVAGEREAYIVKRLYRKSSQSENFELISHNEIVRYKDIEGIVVIDDPTKAMKADIENIMIHSLMGDDRKITKPQDVVMEYLVKLFEKGEI